MSTPYVLKHRFGIPYRHQLAMAGYVGARMGYDYLKRRVENMNPLYKKAAVGAVKSLR